jgi:hypothetical protein
VRRGTSGLEDGAEREGRISPRIHSKRTEGAYGVGRAAGEVEGGADGERESAREAKDQASFGEAHLLTVQLREEKIQWSDSLAAILER